MEFDEFKKSLKDNVPPDGISDLLGALWWDAKGEWERAHETAQEASTNDGSWVHAYLHRKEGDEFNAAYWYSRAGKPKSKESLDQEWETIVKAFLKN